MEPFATTAVAVEWEFRCHNKEVPGRRWEWSCKSREGALVAKSNGYFPSLREAIADANTKGFAYRSGSETSR
jgi:hypothetical protein